MATWQQLADELKTDPALKAVTEEQVEVIIDVLMLIVHADAKVTFMEETELEHLLSELPWIADKETKLQAFINASVARLKDLDGEGRRALVDRSAERLTEAAVREKVYQMASTLAGVDVHLHAEEHEVLTWLADAFAIPDDKRAILG